MAESGTPLLPDKLSQVLAFYLPQFHPIPENDKWWGRGFTEWTNVTRGRPLFKGHYQPHLPADLGFYDLRNHETRELQAALARDAGLGGFVYYHYWFHGRRLLERPICEVIKSGKPDFPFCLCWANEPWSRNWDGKSTDLLMPQVYSAEDDHNHIQWLLDAFADERYIKVDGRPLFLIYRPAHIPNIQKTTEAWRREAQQRGFPDLYLCAVRSFAKEFCDPATFGMDASVEFKPNGTDCGLGLKSHEPLDIGYRLHNVWDYDQMVEYALTVPLPDYPLLPGVCPMWDNSVRRKQGGTIFRNSTPEKFGAWLREILLRENLRPQKESFVFVNAWNEWAEGNHLEPCQNWGDRYLAATRVAINAAREHQTGAAQFTRGQTVAINPQYQVVGNLDHEEPLGSVLNATGWCADADSMTPSDALVYARLESAGFFTLLAAIEHQRLARPDVVEVHGTKQTLLCGWKGQRPLKENRTTDQASHIIALRFRDGAAAVLCPLP